MKSLPYGLGGGRGGRKLQKQVRKVGFEAFSASPNPARSDLGSKSGRKMIEKVEVRNENMYIFIITVRQMEAYVKSWVSVILGVLPRGVGLLADEQNGFSGTDPSSWASMGVATLGFSR